MLYKFLELSTDPENQAKQINGILLQPTIKLSSAKYLNDPNELKFSYGLSKHEKVQIKKNWQTSNRGRSELEFDTWFARIDAETLHRSLTTFRLYRKKNYKIASLSLSAHSNLLWAHYAGSSGGICVIYRKSILKHFEHKYEWLAGPVIYKSKPPIVRLYLDDDLEAMKKTCFWKEKSWNYEKEYRIVVVAGGEDPIFARISQSDIFGIILGINTGDELREKMAGVCIDHGFKLFEIYNYHRSYRLPVVEIKNPKERLMLVRI